MKRRWPNAFGKHINDTAYCDLIVLPKKYGKAVDKSQYCLIIVLKNRKYVFAYPLTNKSDAYKGLHKFFIDIGITFKVVGDPGGEFMGEKWDNLLASFHVEKGKTETFHSWQNRT